MLFGLGERKKKPTITRRQALNSVPVVNPGVGVDDADPEAIELTVFIKRRTGFMSRFQPRVMQRKVKLDRLGSFVFREIDGKRNVRSLVDAFAAEFRVNRREAELSCASFIKSLATRNVISIAVK